jgi:hypothetical protein
MTLVRSALLALSMLLVAPLVAPAPARACGDESTTAGEGVRTAVLAHYRAYEQRSADAMLRVWSPRGAVVPLRYNGCCQPPTTPIAVFARQETARRRHLVPRVASVTVRDRTAEAVVFVVEGPQAREEQFTLASVEGRWVVQSLATGPVQSPTPCCAPSRPVASAR